MIKKLTKFLSVTSLVLSYFIISSLVTITHKDIWLRRQRLNFLLLKFCRVILKVLNIKVHITGYKLEKAQENNNFFIVSNHLSYLDVLILASKIPTGFVTSFEMKGDPVLGPLLTMAGCLFVERRSRKTLKNEISEISRGLTENLNVCVFPEATSTNGSEVIRFRRSLYNSAIETQSPVLPICLNYQTVDREQLNIDNRDLVFWYGDTGFFPHYWNLMGLKEVTVSMHITSPMQTSHETKDSLLANESHQKITEVYTPIKAGPA